MLDILDIRDHACKAARDGRPASESPFADTSVHGQLWLDFYNSERHWLEYCKRVGHDIPEYVAAAHRL